MAEARKITVRLGKTAAKTRKRKVAVFIDGSNFYFKLKSLVPTKMDLIHYRYRDLIKELLG